MLATYTQLSTQHTSCEQILHHIVALCRHLLCVLSLFMSIRLCCLRKVFLCFIAIVYICVYSCHCPTPHLFCSCRTHKKTFTRILIHFNVLIRNYVASVVNICHCGQFGLSIKCHSETTYLFDQLLQFTLRRGVRFLCG